MAKNLTQEQVASLVGMKQQSYQKLESGKTKTTAFILALSNVLAINPEWLQFGKGEGPQLSHMEKTIPYGTLPIIEWEDVTEWNALKGNVENKDWELLQSPNPENKLLFALHIKSDSMVGKPKSFNPGSLVIIDPYPEKLNLQNRYVLVVRGNEGEPILRQWVKEGDKTYLKPLNTEYKIEEMESAHKLCGVVIDHRDPQN